MEITIFIILFICSCIFYCYFWLCWVFVAVHGLFLAAAHRLSCPVVCGILPEHLLNLCPLHWQGDSQSLDHQGCSLILIILN